MMGQCEGYGCTRLDRVRIVPLVTDPFLTEIYDDDTLCYLCDECAQERADDI